MAKKNIIGYLQYLITGDSQYLDKSLKKSQTVINKFSKFVKSALGIGGVIVTFNTVKRVIKDLVAAYSEQEKAESALSAAIRSTGESVEELMPGYKTLASSIQSMTDVGDESVLSLIQQAQSFGVTSDKMEEATKGAIGLSKAFGIDMNTALKGIANAYEGNYAQLSRYIPALRSAGTEAEKLTIMQEAMAGGFEIAKAQAATSAGRMDQLKNTIGDLKEAYGQNVSEGLKPFVEWLERSVRAAADAQANYNEVRKILQEGTSAYGLSSKGVNELTAKIQALEKRHAELQKKVGDVRDETIAARIGLIEYVREINEVEAALKAYNTQLAQTGQYSKIAAEEQKKIPKAAPKLSAEEQKKLWEATIERLSGETEAAVAEYDAQVAAELAYQEEITRIREDAKSEEEKRLQDLATARQQVETATMDFMTGIWGQLDAIYSASANRELTQLKRKHDLELESFTGTEEEKAALAEKFEKEEAEAEYKAALNSWKLQLVGAIAGVARSIIEAAKNFWPIPAIPMMALAAAQGALQIAAIQASKPVPSFAEGADFVVPPGYPNDSYPMNVESGERVQVTPAGKTGGDTLHATINLDGKQIASFVTDAVRRRQILVDQRAVVK